MTTIVGVKAGKDEKAVILGSDISTTQTTWTPQGDIAYRQQIRYEGKKIHVDDSRRIAVSMSGIYDQYFIDFLSCMLNGKIDFEGACKKGYLEELLNLNLTRWEGKSLQGDYSNALLVSTRFKSDDPRLFLCYPLGKVEEKQWISIGSGSEYAFKYISRQGKLIPGRLSLQEGIDLTVSALDEASQDIYTGGLDLAIIKKNKIIEYGKEIKDSISEARKTAIRRLQGKIKSKTFK